MTRGLGTGAAMVAMSRMATGGSVFAIGFALGLLGLIEEFGEFARALAIAHLVSPLADTGGLAALAARSGDEGVGTNRARWRVALVRRVAGRTPWLCAVVVAIGSAFRVSPWSSILVFLAFSGQRLLAELLRAEGRIRLYALGSGLVSSSAWFIATAILGVVGLLDSAFSVSLAFAASAAGTSVVVAVIAYPQAFSMSAVRQLMNMSQLNDLPGQFGLFAQMLAEAAARNVDVILVARVVGPEEAGFYAIASKTVAVALTPLAAASGALATEYSKRWAVGGAALVSNLSRRVSRVIVIVPGLMLAAALVVSSGEFLPNGVVDTARVSIGLLGGATVSAACGSAGLILGICRRELASAWISGVSIAVGIVLLLALGWYGGVAYAAVGFGMGIAANNVGQALYLRRTVGVVSHI